MNLSEEQYMMRFLNTCSTRSAHTESGFLFVETKSKTLFSHCRSQQRLGMQTRSAQGVALERATGEGKSLLYRTSTNMPCLWKRHCQHKTQRFIYILTIYSTAFPGHTYFYLRASAVENFNGLLDFTYIFLSTRNNSIDPCYIIGLRWPSQTRPLYQFLLVHQPEVCTLLSLNTPDLSFNSATL